MIPRRLLIAIALCCGVAAGAIYHAATQRSSVVVAARDIDGLRAIEADDLIVRGFPADDMPTGAVSDPRAAIGRRMRGPVAAGQLILSSQLADDASIFQSGLQAPSGTRAVALPVGPAQALGGALAPGLRVDVIAVPAAGRAPAGRITELVVLAAIVLDVRSESGGPLTRGTGRSSPAAMAERIGSVVVAVPARDELRIADRIGTSTFVLALAPAPSR